MLSCQVVVWLELILGILSVWRITHLFHAEDGPGNVFVRFRKMFGAGFFGQLLDCFYCLSLWVAAPFAFWLADIWGYRVLFWLSFSGGACLLERLTHRPQDASPALYTEDPETRHDGLLRQEQDSVSDTHDKSPGH